MKAINHSARSRDSPWGTTLQLSAHSPLDARKIAGDNAHGDHGEE
jgi:hypothetical protein